MDAHVGRLLVDITEKSYEFIYYYTLKFSNFLKHFNRGGLFYCDEIGLLKDIESFLIFLEITNKDSNYPALKEAYDILGVLGNFDKNRESDEVGEDDYWTLLYESYLKLVNIYPKIFKEFKDYYFTTFGVEYSE